MDEFQYKPNLVPKRDYYSDSTFPAPTQEETVPEIGGTTEEFSFDTLEETKKILTVIQILPNDLAELYTPILERLVVDLKDINSVKEEMKKDPKPEIVIDGPDNNSNGDAVEEDDKLITNKNPGFETTLPNGQKIEFNLFPKKQPMTVHLEKVKPLPLFVRDSFIKDKEDIYRDYVRRLKLMLQQFMKELLHIANEGGFSSYLDLYQPYIKSSESVKKGMQPIVDRVAKNQIERDQKSRLFSKIFNVDQMVYHLIANKATFEQKIRYYQVKYTKADTYLKTQENDELRKLRLEYDKKYENNMYNYYKYLNASTILTDEILKTFISEARGKATLNKNGINPLKGIEEKETKREEMKTKYEDDLRVKKQKEKEHQEKKIQSLKNAGK